MAEACAQFPGFERRGLNKTKVLLAAGMTAVLITGNVVASCDKEPGSDGTSPGSFRERRPPQSGGNGNGGRVRWLMDVPQRIESGLERVTSSVAQQAGRIIEPLFEYGPIIDPASLQPMPPAEEVDSQLAEAV